MVTKPARGAAVRSLVLFLLAGCGGSSFATTDAASAAVPVGTACAAGQQIECPCGGGVPNGVQVCRDDGSGYGDCRCDQVTNEPDGAVGAGHPQPDAHHSAEAGSLDAGAEASETSVGDAGGEASEVHDSGFSVPDGSVVSPPDWFYLACTNRPAGDASSEPEYKCTVLNYVLIPKAILLNADWTTAYCGRIPLSCVASDEQGRLLGDVLPRIAATFGPGDGLCYDSASPDPGYWRCPREAGFN